ncbi:RsmE family RNA methyltransferase [bacterium]|nr:RsmE family RNA methyltransferase [bacterium]
MNKKNNLQQHEFAFYIPSLKDLVPTLLKGSLLHFSDEHLFHRMVRVVRLEVGSTCILFDREVNLQFEITVLKGKKNIEGVIGNTIKNISFLPSVTFLLPILKKDQFEKAIYSLVELGATVIQPIFTEKSQRKWGTEKDIQRASSIMIKAAEQSKTFSFAQLLKVMTLKEYCSVAKNESDKIFFDPSGKHIKECVEQLSKESLVLMVGPEGDITKDEKLLLKKSGFEFCALTPTIMRACQAVAVSVGLFRSFLGAKKII